MISCPFCKELVIYDEDADTLICIKCNWWVHMRDYDPSLFKLTENK
jgi:uncharacterized protein YbaR (Trm112 family)